METRKEIKRKAYGCVQKVTFAELWRYPEAGDLTDEGSSMGIAIARKYSTAQKQEGPRGTTRSRSPLTVKRSDRPRGQEHQGREPSAPKKEKNQQVRGRNLARRRGEEVGLSVLTK